VWPTLASDIHSMHSADPPSAHLPADFRLHITKQLVQAVVIGDKLCCLGQVAFAWSVKTAQQEDRETVVPHKGTLKTSCPLVQ
jgi:hypothetical protein